MKIRQGALASAWANRLRTRAAPTPTNISTKSEPESEKNGTPASPATALASSVLPVPGGPTSRTPLGIRPPSAWYFSGVLEELDDLAQLGDGLVVAGDVVERDPALVLVVDLGPALGEGHRRAHPPPPSGGARPGGPRPSRSAGDTSARTRPRVGLGLGDVLIQQGGELPVPLQPGRETRKLRTRRRRALAAQCSM